MSDVPEGKKTTLEVSINRKVMKQKRAEDLQYHDQYFESFIHSIIHDWSKTLAALAFVLVPLFFILDYFAMPEHLLGSFVLYRSFSTIIPFTQYIILKNTKPGRFSFIHGYITSITVSVAIILMTFHDHGFDSRYYAGLNLIIIAANLLLPWRAVHSAINGLLTIAFYFFLNFFFGAPYSFNYMMGNLFFMISTVIIAVSITHVRYKLIKQEFFLRSELKAARDALWGEMEIAKKIQKSLLPEIDRLGNYQIAAIMQPAKEIGGDYYDIIKTVEGEHWMSIGDVSGHGVESGLIMMMTQTSIFSLINNTPGLNPSKVLSHTNSVINNNISRLKSNFYMTILSIKMEKDHIVVAGKHQDIMIYRAGTNEIEIIPTEGTWIGLIDDIEEFLVDKRINIEKNDIILLFTDGVTEAADVNGQMFGDARLRDLFKKFAKSNVNTIVDNILKEVAAFQEQQEDDITILAVKKIF